MTAVALDSGAISRLSKKSVAARERLRRLRSEGLWPPLVPSVVLSESLTGDNRRDFDANRLLAMCEVDPVEEVHSRRAAHLRTAARKGSGIDAVVVAMAEGWEALVLTQDAEDLAGLAAHTEGPVRIERV